MKEPGFVTRHYTGCTLPCSTRNVRSGVPNSRDSACNDVTTSWHRNLITCSMNRCRRSPSSSAAGSSNSKVGVVCVASRLACRERLEQRVVVGPAPDVVQLHIQSAQRCDGLPPMRLKLGQEPPPGLRDDFTQTCQLWIPNTR